MSNALLHYLAAFKQSVYEAAQREIEVVRTRCVAAIDSFDQAISVPGSSEEDNTTTSSAELRSSDGQLRPGTNGDEKANA